MMAMRNFWVGIKFKQCKCGKKEEIHGFCQNCWDTHGRKIVTAEAEKEQIKLNEEMAAEETRLQKMWKLLKSA